MKLIFHTDSEIIKIVPVGYVLSPETIAFTAFTGKLSHVFEASALILQFYQQRIPALWLSAEGWNDELLFLAFVIFPL